MSLHFNPNREPEPADDLQVCWSGASWRDYPQPVTPPPTLAATLGTRIDERLQKASRRALVVAALSDRWQGTSALMHRTGLSDCCVQTWTRRLWQEGRLERIKATSVEQARGRHGYLYRLKGEA